MPVEPAPEAPPATLEDILNPPVPVEPAPEAPVEPTPEAPPATLEDILNPPAPEAPVEPTPEAPPVTLEDILNPPAPEAPVEPAPEAPVEPAPEAPPVTLEDILNPPGATDAEMAAQEAKDQAERDRLHAEEEAANLKAIEDAQVAGVVPGGGTSSSLGGLGALIPTQAPQAAKATPTTPAGAPPMVQGFQQGPLFNMGRQFNLDDVGLYGDLSPAEVEYLQSIGLEGAAPATVQAYQGGSIDDLLRYLQGN